MTTTLIIPGLYSSGPDHWQTWLEDRVPGTLRVAQSDWTKPDLPEWSRRVRHVIKTMPGKLVIVAHSFGVLASVQAAADFSERIAGALFVAPADPDRFGVAGHLPQGPLPFPTVLVASSNDPWMQAEQAAQWARRWHSEFVNLGAAGHINAEAGFGPWPEGLEHVERLRRHADGDAADRELAPELDGVRAYRNSVARRGAHLHLPRADATRRSHSRVPVLGVG